MSRDREIANDAVPGSEMLLATRWWVWQSGRVNGDGEIKGGIIWVFLDFDGAS